MSKVRHIEFAGPDADSLRSFYGRLFGWAASGRDVGGYQYFDLEMPGGLTAGIRQEPQGVGEIVAYVDVEDLATSVQQAQALGAKIRIPPKIVGAIRFALVEDPAGNPIGLTEELKDRHAGKVQT